MMHRIPAAIVLVIGSGTPMTPDPPPQPQPLPVPDLIYTNHYNQESLDDAIRSIHLAERRDRNKLWRMREHQRRNQSRRSSKWSHNKPRP